MKAKVLFYHHTLIFAIFLMFAVGGCKQSHQQHINKDCEECPEPRAFVIDLQKLYLIVSVFGRGGMGTPNGGTVHNYLQSSQDSGLIENLIVLAYGYEGGLEYCIEMIDEDNRRTVIDELIAIPTDLNETIYRLESTNDCLHTK